MDFAPIRFGKYLLLERINIGGMAEVFRAKTFGVEGFERIVAIKRILPNLVEDEEFVTMFIDEARIAVQLNHPSIAQIYELGKHGDHYYIAMEFLASRDLRLILDRLKEQERIMPISQAAFIATKICEALDYAHRKRDPGGTPMNIIHRDVSPQNILVSFEGDVKMIDFGIAKAANRASKTQVGVLKGKFAYMSPEQVRGLPIDRRSDVFAVGIVLYEMLTGERLFIAESDFSTLQKVRDAVVETPTRFNQNIPSELEHIILRALAREVVDRFQWASELSEALQPFLIQGRSIYGPKKLAETIREEYEPEVSIERAKMEHFRTVGLSGKQFGGAGEETEPQDNESHDLPRVTRERLSTKQSGASKDGDGETIIFEASRAGSLIDNAQDLKKESTKNRVDQDGSVTAESDTEGFSGNDDSDATIVQMTSPFFAKQELNERQSPDAEIGLRTDEKEEGFLPHPNDVTGLDSLKQPTFSSQDSDMATMAIPIEELRKGDPRFQKPDANKAGLMATGENPSVTLPEDPSADYLVGSNESTAAAQNPVNEPSDGDKGFSYTADTVGLEADAAKDLIVRVNNEIDTKDFPQRMVLPNATQTEPIRPAAAAWGEGVSVNALTASQSIPSTEKTGRGMSGASNLGSFSEFYGSRRSANPLVAFLASWIRMVPKGFRVPVFMAVGAVLALFLVLMVVATYRVFNAPVGQIQLQKVSSAELPAGLRIYLDNALVGKNLPLRLPEVPPGKHVVRAEAEAPCETSEFEVSVSEGQAAFIPLPIYCGSPQEPTKPKVAVFEKWQVKVRTVDHRGRGVKRARVYIDDKRMGTTPFSTLVDSKTSSVNIRVEANGYATKRFTASHSGIEIPPPIVVDLGKKKGAVEKAPAPKKPTSVENEIKMAQLELLVRPDATVFLDGKSTGRTTPLSGSRALNLAVGVHVIEFLVKRTQKKYQYRVKVLEASPQNKIVIPKLGKDKIRLYGKIEVKRLRP